MSFLCRKKIRSATGLSQREFAEHYHIPLQTLKQWESAPESSSHRTPPDYVLYLLEANVLVDFNDQRRSADTADSRVLSDQETRLIAYDHLLRAAQDSYGDARLWYRYLRKEFKEDSCRIDPDGIDYLLNSDVLSMFQKVSLKRAVTPGSPTNICITNLNKKATTPMLDAIRQLESFSPKELDRPNDVSNIDESLLLEAFGMAYSMDWLEQYFIENEEEINRRILGR